MRLTFVTLLMRWPVYERQSKCSKYKVKVHTERCHRKFAPLGNSPPFLQEGDIPRYFALPGEKFLGISPPGGGGKFPRNNVPRGAILRRDGFPRIPDAIWTRDANFGFLLSFNFIPFQSFSNFLTHFSNLS